MKKVLRLTESKLIGLVSKILNEKKGGDPRQKHYRYDEENGNILLGYGNQSDIDNILNNLPENIKFLALMYCDGFADFSNINICEFPKITFVSLKGTKNNFEELFDCYEKMSDNMYDLAKPEPPYFKDDRISDVPEPRFSMNESDLKRLVNKVITEAKRLKNQDMIDAILDKIGLQGIDSLDDTEKYILDNPDVDLDKTGDSDFMSHELDCLKSYIEFMFEPSDVETDEDGNYINHEGGDLYVWNNNEPPEDTEDCFDRFIGYLGELVNSGAFVECEGMDLNDVDAHVYEFFLDEIERQKHFRDDFDELLQ